MLDIEIGAEFVELMLASCGALAKDEKAIGELLAVVGENGADADRGGPFEITKEAPGEFYLTDF